MWQKQPEEMISVIEGIVIVPCHLAPSVEQLPEGFFTNIPDVGFAGRRCGFVDKFQGLAHFGKRHTLRHIALVSFRPDVTSHHDDRSLELKKYH